MPDGASFEVLNAKEYSEAMRLAPKDMQRGLRREFERGRKRFVNVTRKALFSGGSGIQLPAREKASSIRKSRRGKKGREGAASNIRSIQLRHLLTKLIVQIRVIVLIGRLSRFSTFHESRLRPIFDGMFQLSAFALRTRLKREAARLAQLAIDKRLKLSASRFR